MDNQLRVKAKNVWAIDHHKASNARYLLLSLEELKTQDPMEVFDFCICKVQVR